MTTTPKTITMPGLFGGTVEAPVIRVPGLTPEPLVRTTPTTITVTIHTRSKAVYALVKVYYEKGGVTPGPFKAAEIVGYAHTAGPAVVARVRRRGAKLVPIVGGKVTLEVRA